MYTCVYPCTEHSVNVVCQVWNVLVRIIVLLTKLFFPFLQVQQPAQQLGQHMLPNNPVVLNKPRVSVPNQASNRFPIHQQQPVIQEQGDNVQWTWYIFKDYFIKTSLDNYFVQSMANYSWHFSVLLYDWIHDKMISALLLKETLICVEN